MLVVRMALLLDGGEAEASDDRTRAGEQEAGDEVDERPGGRGIEAGGERGGNAGELLVLERPIDRPAVAIDHIERPAVIAPEIRTPPARPVRPNRNPARIVEERIGKDLRRRVVLVSNKGANFHARDLP